MTKDHTVAEPQKEFVFALQGLTPVELYGLQSRLSFAQCTELLGNGFASNVVAAVSLAALIYVL